MKDRRYWTTEDVHAGQRLDVGPWTGATVVSVASNGWCQMKWDDGRKFSMRVHQLTPKDQRPL